jgi:hypothetical protein
MPLRLVLPLALILASLAGPAWADLGQGRWECVAYGAVPALDPNAPPPAPPAGAPIDPATGKPMVLPAGVAPDIPHGLLTIYGTSYTYASEMGNDPTSGAGDVDQQNGLVTFTNGSLPDGAKVEAGKINSGAGPLSMDLIGESGPVYSCTAR